MDKNFIKKQIRLNNRDAASLFKRYEAINELGTGILSSVKDKMSSQLLSSACILLSLEQIKNFQYGVSNNLVGIRTIYVKIQSSQFISIEFINKLLAELRTSKQYNSISHLFNGFYLKWSQQLDKNQFIQIIRYLQSQSFVILIEPQLSVDSWNNYQRSLNNFSYSILENQNILLSCVSLVLAFPQIHSLNYTKILLSIWKRVIPCGIGRIVLKDSDNQNYLSLINDLFHVKNLPISWKVQFITSKINNWLQLQQRVAGIA